MLPNFAWCGKYWSKARFGGLYAPRLCVMRRGTNPPEFYDASNYPEDAWDPEDWAVLQPRYDRWLAGLRSTTAGLMLDYMSPGGLR